jgi:hypothetical protein
MNIEDIKQAVGTLTEITGAMQDQDVLVLADLDWSKLGSVFASEKLDITNEVLETFCEKFGVDNDTSLQILQKEIDDFDVELHEAWAELQELRESAENFDLSEINATATEIESLADQIQRQIEGMS